MLTSGQIKGLERQHAEELLKKAGHRYRVVRVDGQPRVVTADYNPNRFNLHIQDGVVVDCYTG